MAVQNVSAPSAIPVSSAPRPVARPVAGGAAPAVDTAEATLAKIEQMLADTLPAPHELKLDIDPTTRTVIGRVINKNTGEVVRQIPTEEMMALIARSAQVNALLNKKI